MNFNWVRKAASTFTSFVAMRFSGGWGGWSMFLRGGNIDYARAVGDGSRSSIVMACVNWICRTFPEAPLQVVMVKDDGVREVKRRHPLTALLKNPNPFYSGSLLWSATLADYTRKGNAYWIKIRNKYGMVTQLWWVPEQLMEPRWVEDGSQFIGWYEYQPNGEIIQLLPRDVVHFRNGLDPHNPRKGLSPLGSLIRELYTDAEAANFSASLLKNLGIPGVILSPSDDKTDVSPKDMEKMKSNFRSSFSGDNRGEPLVLGANMKVSTLSFSPVDLDLTALRRLPEERVTAIFGVPAIVAGLGAGLDRSTFANMKEAREAAYESNIIPTQRLLAAELEAQLLIDFEDMGAAAKEIYEISFDLSQVRVLQEDENKKIERLGKGLKDGLYMRSEARSGAGLKVEKRDEVFYLPTSVMEVGPGAPEVEPLPALPAPAPRDDNAKSMAATRAAIYVFTKAQQWRSGMEKQLRGAMKKYLDKQYEAAATWAAQRTKDAPLQLPLDMGPELQRIFTKYYPLMLQQAYKDADLVLDVGLAFDLDNPFVQEVLDQLGLLIKSDIPATTVAEIQALVGRQAEEGWSAEVLADEIRQLKEVRSPVRAQLIAVTETARGYSLGSKMAYMESGVVEAMEWLVTEPCDVCKQNDGKQVALDGGVFPSGHELPPAHPGCKCAIVPVLTMKSVRGATPRLEVVKAHGVVDIRVMRAA